jgi:hypothetical protein
MDDWIYCTSYIHTLGITDKSDIAILHILQFTVAHALGLSVLTSRTLATDLSQQSHRHFKSHMKSTLHRLSPFCQLFCSCQFRRLDSASLDYCCVLRGTPSYLLTVPFHKSSARTPRKTPPSIVNDACFCCMRMLCGNVFTESLPSNGYTHHHIFFQFTYRPPKWYFAFRFSC